MDRGLWFEVFDDGTVVMFVFGNEVDRRKLKGAISNTRIHHEFGTELHLYGVGIDPKMEMASMRKDIGKLRQEVEKLRKERK